ncbi:Metalloendopeptidase OMA1 [Sarcoptes scabiei]|uniref:Metalloendopeptidase OMA1, mitochondrial n=1 Tax=Sarcoptes scabiei TaxID=52283 RepID=A0A834R9G4_SARSC|nr:Metalloendopeptidase OMA1 [Sarcoptes scabiei]
MFDSNKFEALQSDYSDHVRQVMKMEIGDGYINNSSIFNLLLSITSTRDYLDETSKIIAFTSGQFDYLNKIELEAKLNDYSGKLLPSNHPITQRVGRVVKRLISHNNDIDEIKKHDWTVSVIDDLTIMNAFVLASGNIFVFSGLLNFCENDNQLGIILSHEISHAILGHGIELASHAHIVDLLFIGILGFIWMLFPTDLIAFIGTTVSRILLKIGMETPYNKMLETEADEVGLILAAKACFDIREATVFWDDMAFLEKSDLAAILGSSDLPINLDFLSTHPTHNERSENLDKLIEKTLKYRNNECPPLPEIDPRIRAEIRRKERLMQQLKKEKFGVLKIQDLK